MTISPVDLQKALKGAEYPTSKEDLVALAKKNGAGGSVVDELDPVSADRFDGPNDVQKAVFHGR
ncbi:DUF2795 domain-containing protein [Streptomyces montanisoli]|uniref:DUF2795 domain-containing protein n=1 Tax=Streptomyces montanisoli TaxID=2798581 RepID=A0A940MDB7_9ACTN|nr:DUF2795 domain-containing protein [Streptomyces montanisoli]MBP0456991.1 DUF2795 domain-containing protein [Streptomyces montanisoli]